MERLLLQFDHERSLNRKHLEVSLGPGVLQKACIAEM